MSVMNFLEILDGAEVLSQSGDCVVKGLDYDSRRVRLRMGLCGHAR